MLFIKANGENTLNEQHLENLKAAVEAFGGVYIHADGNIYNDTKIDGVVKETAKSKSDYHKEFHSPNENSPCKMRCYFDKNSKLPDTVEELEQCILKGREADIKDMLKPTIEKELQSIKVSKKKKQ